MAYQQEVIEINTKDRFELLRLILESMQKRSVSYGEAQDIGESLISFYEVLAGVTLE